MDNFRLSQHIILLKSWCNLNCFDYVGWERGIDLITEHMLMIDLITTHIIMIAYQCVFQYGNSFAGELTGERKWLRMNWMLEVISYAATILRRVSSTNRTNWATWCGTQCQHCSRSTVHHLSWIWHKISPFSWNSLCVMICTVHINQNAKCMEWTFIH